MKKSAYNGENRISARLLKTAHNAGRLYQDSQAPAPRRVVYSGFEFPKFDFSLQVARNQPASTTMDGDSGPSDSFGTILIESGEVIQSDQIHLAFVMHSSKYQ